MIKDIIKEELADMLNNEGAGNSSGNEGAGDEGADNKAGVSNNDDKGTDGKQNDQQAGEDDKTDNESAEQFNVELRSMIKKEMRGFAADLLNKEVATGGQKITADDVYSELLGFPTKSKGGK